MFVYLLEKERVKISCSQYLIDNYLLYIPLYKFYNNNKYIYKTYTVNIYRCDKQHLDNSILLR